MGERFDLSKRRARPGLAGLMLALEVLVTGCLVTEKVDYDAPNSPPSVTPLSPVPSGWLSADPDPGCNGDVPFVARIADNDVDQPLSARLLVNGAPGIGREIGVATDNGVDRGSFLFCARRDLFNQPCHYVELLVTSGFSEADPPYSTRIPGDLARVYWLVLGSSDGRQSDAKPDDCARLFDNDGGLP